MTLQQRFPLWIILVAAFANPAPAQTGAIAPVTAGLQSTASIPDFSGVWRHGSLPWFIPPASGPGPVTNRSRRKDNGQSNYGLLVGDYTNPILQPWAAEVVKKKGDLALAGIVYPNPANQCWPEPVPFLFKHMGMQMLQLPDKIVMIFSEDHEVREVRLDATHPAQVKPSWHGDAVGHYEGDMLVVDTVGVRTDHPYAMVDLFGTPYTDKLHVVERYRLLDYDTAKGDIERAAKENWRPAGPIKVNEYKDKYLQVHFTIEDPGAFTTPWTTTMIYIRDHDEFPETACAESRLSFQGENIPKADRPDF